MNNADKTKNIDAINNMNKDYKPVVFDFIAKRKIFLIIACAVFVTGMVSFFTRGFNWDIDFLGGTILEYDLKQDIEVADLNKIEKLIEDIVGERPSSVVKSGTQGVVIKTKDIDSDTRTAISEGLQNEYDSSADDSKFSNVNPTVGEALTRSTILSVVIASVLMLIYITFRFNFKSGLATVLCLLFDLFVMLTFYSLLQISMNTAVIAAFLTLLGYSINATIIIFDRVRENVKLKKGGGMKFADIVNLSVSQTLARSLNTTITTAAVLLCVFILGVPSIRTFVLPLMVGITSGLFSSICLAGSLWSLFRGEDKAKSK